MFDRHALFTPIDKKPKRVSPRQLRRVRNIAATPRVAVSVDAYREDWRCLWHILVLVTASVMQPGTTDHAHAVRLLRRKYRQYHTMPLEDNLVLQIVPHRIASWRTCGCIYRYISSVGSVSSSGGGIGSSGLGLARRSRPSRAVITSLAASERRLTSSEVNCSSGLVTPCFRIQAIPRSCGVPFLAVDAPATNERISSKAGVDEPSRCSV